jgi:hypothetical protein
VKRYHDQPGYAESLRAPDAFDKYGHVGGGEAGAGADRIVKREAVIAQVIAGGASAGTARFRVLNPSSRVRVKIGVSFFPLVPTESITLSAQAVTLTPLFTDAEGAEAPADTIVSGEALPYAYEGETAAEIFAGVVALVSAGGTSLEGYYKVIVTWEAPEDMPQERWNLLASRVGVKALNSTRPQIAPGASP